MILDVNDILNYSICPMRYKFSKEEANDNEVIVEKKYSNVVRKSIFTYFSSIQNGIAPTFGSLKRTFGNLWIGEKNVNEILFSEPVSWRNKEEQKRKKGITSLNKFNQYFKDKLYYPILIDYKYEVAINKFVSITGTIDLVVDNNGKLDLIEFRTNDIKNDCDYINRSFKITGACYAFEDIFKEKIEKILSYGLNKNSVNLTFRNNNNYKAFKDDVINIAKCIHNNIFYISPSNYCSKCFYKNKCLNMKGGI